MHTEGKILAPRAHRLCTARSMHASRNSQSVVGGVVLCIVADWGQHVADYQGVPEDSKLTGFLCSLNFSVQPWLWWNVCALTVCKL